MRVWITKYALSKGIFELDVRISSGGRLAISSAHHYYHGDGIDWHRTFESAVSRAEVMRAKKIESLNRQIAKMGKLDFNAQQATR